MIVSVCMFIHSKLKLFFMEHTHRFSLTIPVTFLVTITFIQVIFWVDYCYFHRLLGFRKHRKCFLHFKPNQNHEMIKYNSQHNRTTNFVLISFSCFAILIATVESNSWRNSVAAQRWLTKALFFASLMETRAQDNMCWPRFFNCLEILRMKP